MSNISTKNDVLQFLEGRLAHLKGLHLMDKLSKERLEMERLEAVLGLIQGRRKAPDIWKFYDDNYKGKDVYTPANFLPAA